MESVLVYADTTRATTEHQVAPQWLHDWHHALAVRQEKKMSRTKAYPVVPGAKLASKYNGTVVIVDQVHPDGAVHVSRPGSTNLILTSVQYLTATHKPLEQH
jgi:hypothetical protein